MKQKEILFGCAYYLEYMPEDRMREDMRMMRDAGMNVIRIGESTWSTWEPVEGEFDFSLLDEMLDLAEAYGMKVVVGTPSYAIPAWLSQKSDDIMVETSDGKALYGHRQLFNIASPTFRFYIERVIRKMMEHCANRSCVIGYQVDNETKHYGTAGADVQERFREYLKKKFGTVEELNRTFYLRYWSNSIGRWEDLPDMRGCVNGGLASEFEAFQRSLVTEYLCWQRGILDEYRSPDQFVTHNLDYNWKKFGAEISQDGYSYGVQPGCDHDKIGKALTIAGTDIYHPTQHELTGVEIAFGGDEMRGIVPGSKNYLVLETEAQAFREWVPYPGQLRLQAYSHLASGASMLEYWHWHSIHNGYETYWKGLLSHDFALNPTYLEAKQFGNEWKRIGAENLLLTKICRAAMIVDNRTLTGYRWFPFDKDLSYNDVVMETYGELFRLNIGVDILFEDQITGEDGIWHNIAEEGNSHRTEEGTKKCDRCSLDGYDLIVIPSLYSVSEEFIQIIRDWTEAGGVLVATFRSFFADRSLSVWPDTQPHHMTDVFGITYNQFVNPERLTVNGFEARHWAELLTPMGENNQETKNCTLETTEEEQDTDVSRASENCDGNEKVWTDVKSQRVKDDFQVLGQYEHPYWNIYAGITKNRFGKGMAYYIGCHTDPEELRQVLVRASADAGLWLPHYEDKETGNTEQYTWPVILRSGVNAKEQTVHYLLYYSENPETIHNPYGAVTDLISGRTYAPGEKIELKDWDVKVLVET
ncbi:MAG: alpha-amylase family protein [Bilifractor sp.]|nr:beta-galactosidase [Lachnospiraceae bacterium]MDY2837915.1 alpha-amylase family protein [Bilifractor sp.]